MDLPLTFKMLRFFGYGNYVIASVESRDNRGFASRFKMHLSTRDKKKALAYKKWLKEEGQDSFLIGFSQKKAASLTPEESAEFYRQYYGM